MALILTYVPRIDFNDQLSNFIITGGRWTLYEHVNYHWQESHSWTREVSPTPTHLETYLIAGMTKLARSDATTIDIVTSFEATGWRELNLNML